MLDIYNITMTLCANFGNVFAYRILLEQCFKEFERSCISNKFNELLFNYTENPLEVRKLFTDTDDYQKYTFFAGNTYLVNVKTETVQPSENAV
jgi:hypothetical protein